MPARKRRPIWALALLWLAVAALLYLALRGVPLPLILGMLARLAGWQILLLLALNLAILLLMSARWALVLRSMGARVPLFSLVAYRLAGMGVSYFTPGPQFGGEPVQVHLLYTKHRVPLSTAVSSVFLDRLVDLLANFTFLSVGIVVVFSGPLQAHKDSGGLILAAGLVAFPLAHLFALAAGKRPAGWLAKRLEILLAPRLRGRSTLLHHAAEIVCDAEGKIARFLREKPLHFGLIVALSGLAWLAMVFEFWLMVRFLGIPAGLVETISAQTAARLAFLLPLPAGLGALEASQVLATGKLGWDPAAGIAISLVIRARDVFFGLLGLWFSAAAYRSVLLERRVSKERS